MLYCRTKKGKKDANEKIEVERKIIIAVEGKPSDHWNVLKYYTIEDV